MSRHVMIDLETLSLKPGGAIASIGALEFYPEANVIGKELHIAVNTTSCLLAGLTVDPGTVNWWKKQSAMAREAITDNPATLQAALRMLNDLLIDPDLHIVPDGIVIWCRGTSFDPVMLEAAFEAAGMKPLWKYWQWRDMRTLLKVCEECFGYMEPARSDTAHDALDDCRHQSRIVTECLALLMPKPAPILVSAVAA